jgi:GNAT superfamily N-acetyltransferase
MPAATPEDLAEQFILSLEPDTPESEAYANFLETMLRWMFRSCGWNRHVASQLEYRVDNAGLRAKDFVTSLSEDQCLVLREMLNESLRDGFAELLFLLDGYKIQGINEPVMGSGLGCEPWFELRQMSDSILVHPATERDIAYLKPIQKVNWQRYIAPIIGQEAMETALAKHLWQPGKSLVLVGEMEEEGDVVGFASVALEKSELADAEVTALHVLRFFRGRKVGQRLLASVAGKARENGASSLVLWTLADNAYTVEFCKRRGGEEVAEREAEYAPGFREIAFRWTDLEALEKQGEV